MSKLFLAALLPLMACAFLPSCAAPNLAQPGDPQDPEVSLAVDKDQAVAKIDELNKEVAASPRDLPLLRRRAHNYAVAGLYDEAIQDFTILLSRVNPDDRAGYFERAHCYLVTHKWAEAIADYKEVLPTQLPPNKRYRALRGLGISYYNLGQYQDALASFTEAEAMFADNQAVKAEMSHDRALCDEKLGKADDAAKERASAPKVKEADWWLR